MTTIKKSIIASIIIIATATTLISTLYTIAFPIIAPNYKTYDILVIGIIFSATAGGYVGHKTFADEAFFIKIGFGICYALAVAISALLLSLFIILNIRGA